MTSPAGRAAPPGLAPQRPLRADAGLVVGVVVIAACAWLTLLMLGGGHEHAAAPSAEEVAAHAAHGHDHAHQGSGLVDTVGGTVLGWTLMVTAMMLPPALPLVRTLRALGSGTSDPGGVVAAGSAAFLAVWVLVGGAFWTGDLLLDAALAGSASPARAGVWTSGAAIAAAGIYQLTPAKRACLTACRSPRSVALSRWRGVHPPDREAASIGLAYGAVCVGCCWALMVVTFAVGAAAMPVMLALTAVMGLERLVRPARAFTLLVAAGCLALALAVVTGLVPPGLLSSK